MPDAARLSDFHLCPKVEPGPVPHVGGPIFTGSANVIIGFLPAARVDDSIVCFPIGPTDRIKSGSTTVLINHRAAARKTDPGVHISGNVIVRGCPTVIIGDSPQSFTLRAAARRGTPFCEECERKRREQDGQDHSGARSTPAPPGPDTATLDDDQPPPGAMAGRDLLSSIDLNRQDLARQADQNDGLDGERRAARVSVAYQFYAAHTGGRIKPSRISSHIRAIDCKQPIEVISVSRLTMYQHGVPGADDGQYFALDPAVTPDQLGTSSTVYGIKDGKPTPPPVLRDRRVTEFGEASAYGLKSVAAPIPDTWSMPSSATHSGQTVDCGGGGTQVMIPAIFHASAHTTIL